MKITEETRQLSFEDIKPKRQSRYNKILEYLNRPKTVMELVKEMFKSDNRNLVAPRLTELEKMGYVKTVGKKKCQYTNAVVAVYERTQKGFEALNYDHIPRID